MTPFIYICKDINIVIYEIINKVKIVNKISVLVLVGTIVSIGSDIKNKTTDDNMIDSKIVLLMSSISILKEIIAMVIGKNKNDISQKSEEPNPKLLEPNIYNAKDIPKLKNKMKK